MPILEYTETENEQQGWKFIYPKTSSYAILSVKLEVMGKKVKNATFISGNEAGKILKEIQKVEKRRIVKSTLYNERSSRSHCMIIVDVLTVGGRLMLVDIAGSENIEQAGQTGLEAKMQTAKINQGNIALKRVVESIANGDSHVSFRGSKLTMLLQFIFTLQVENNVREREQNEAQKELSKKEEVAALRAKLAVVESRGSEEEISLKVNERTKIMKSELDRKIQECRRMADELVEMERQKMEERCFNSSKRLKC
ncbi:hypothetical protein ACS0TY_007159 [Phlomoides rotata]